MKRTTMKRHLGFTLIELLVVVAIISLLVSILLPSLSKAKELAKTVVCMTNLKNIMTAALIYENEEDFLPPHRNCTFNGSPDEASRWEYIDNKGCIPPSTSASESQDFFPKLFADILVDRGLAGEELFDCPVKPEEGMAGSASGSNRPTDKAFNYAINIYLSSESGTVVKATPGLPSWGTPASLSQIQDDLSQAMLYGDNSVGVSYTAYYWPYPIHNGGVAMNYVFFDGHAETWNLSAYPHVFGTDTTDFDDEQTRQFWLWYSRN